MWGDLARMTVFSMELNPGHRPTLSLGCFHLARMFTGN